MQLSSVDANSEGFSLHGVCPHCHCKAGFITVTHPHIEEIAALGKDKYHEMIGALRCWACNKYILAVLESDPHKNKHEMWQYVASYPISVPDDSVSEHVPGTIHEDFREALRCRPVALKASVMMCRRALQTSCHTEGATGNNLFEQIDDLATKQRITGTLRDMAHNIRLLGNKGAHSGYVDIDSSITANDADDAIDFMRHYLDHMYVLPSRLKRLPKVS